MPSLLDHVGRAWQWFWSAEDLGTPTVNAGSDQDPADRPHSTTVRSLFFATGDLPSQVPQPAAGGPRPTTLWGLFFATGDLPSQVPQPAAGGPRPTTLWGLFFATDDLPSRTPQPQSRTSFLSWLTAPESLPDAKTPGNNPHPTEPEE